MNGFRVMGRVLANGTKNTAWRIWWYQAALAMEGSKRASAVVLRAFGSLLLVWFLGGTLLVLGWLWYVLAAGWFVAVGVFADIEVGTDQALPSPTDDPYCADEDAGQGVVVEKGRIGKAPVLRIQDPKDPARTHLVWLGKPPVKGAS
jgi:hypothetical protein